jgi:hypothetical protein
VALVRFFGGGGNPGSIQAVTLENEDGKELARWSSGGGELPEALAAPIWGPLRAVSRPSTDHWAADVGCAGAVDSDRTQKPANSDRPLT